jgi:hypothetical protein
MKPLFFAMALCAAMAAHAQNVGIGTSAPNSNAKLDITATDKGLLIPRMDSVHRKAIPNTVGLLLYDSSTSSFWYNTGTAWQNLATANAGWSLTGNSGIDTGKNFLGTVDNNALIFKVNNGFAGKLGDGVVSIGQDAYLNNQNPNNMALTAVGIGALHNNINNPVIYLSGYHNTAVGQATLFYNTTGQANTAVGAYSLNSSTTGDNNTAMGSHSMLHNTTGFSNSALGAGSLAVNYSASYNTALGESTLASNDASFNTAVGALASRNSSTPGNTAVGYRALYNNFGGANNTAIGYNSGLAVNNPSINNATAIGANAKVDASNKIRLGDAQITAVESSGTFNTVSDGRFKYNIREDVKGLDFILQLRPVTYQLNSRTQEAFSNGIHNAETANNNIVPVAFRESDNIKRTGFIAQEVAAAAQKTGYSFDGVKIPATDKQYYSLSYASFVVPLVKAVQEQEETINALKKQNQLLQRQNELVQQQNAAILKRLTALEKNRNPSVEY